MTRLAQRERKIPAVRLRAIKGALVLASLLVPAVVATRPGQAPPETPSSSIPAYSVLYSFKGTPDGASPAAGVIRDAAGNFYGTTFYGGASGWGTVFKLDTTGKETVLYSFTGGADGANPYNAGLVSDTAGNLYGTTYYGGSVACSPPTGCGVVFKVDPAGRETVLHSFTGGADGSNPNAGLVRDVAGNLYGTTGFGGSLAACNTPYGCGVVFKVDPTGKETVLHSFAGYPTDGASGATTTFNNPFYGARLVRDAAGNLYATTPGGGASRDGTVFKLDAAGKETVLYSFTGGADGGNPFAGLVRDTAGNLYGTAWTGGSGDCGADSCGVVFKVDTNGKETVLHSFAYSSAGSAGPNDLIRDSAGNLYGTTAYGGSACGSFGCGVVFKLAP